MPPQHILIVEDSELVTQALRILFEADAHRVSTASTIADAAAIAQAHHVDVMLLDLTLPDGDGLSVLQHLDETTRPTTILAMTGHDDRATQARCLAAGCHQVLVKPVPVSSLRQLVTAL